MRGASQIQEFLRFFQVRRGVMLSDIARLFDDVVETKCVRAVLCVHTCTCVFACARACVVCMYVCVCVATVPRAHVVAVVA